MLRPEDFFDLEGNHLKGLFRNAEFVWEGLKNIKSYIEDNITPNVADLRKNSSLLDRDMIIYDGEVLESGFTIDNASGTVTRDGAVLKGASIIYAGVFLADDEIYIGRGTIIESGALIKGPAMIGDDNEIRQGAYMRGNVIVGNKCVVGHTTEMKTAVMLGESKAGHFAYLGDSILGRVNLGAGTKLANLKIFESKINPTVNGKKYETGLRKFGAIFADGVETGCNTVTMPGSLLSKNVLVYPNTTVRGYCPPDTIIKSKNNTEMRKRR